MADERSLRNRSVELGEAVAQVEGREAQSALVTGQSLLDRIPEAEWRKHSEHPLVAVNVTLQSLVDSGSDEDLLFQTNTERFPNDVIVIALSKFFGRTAA